MMTPEIAMKKSLQAVHILSEIWHPDLPQTMKSHLQSCVEEVRMFAEMCCLQDEEGGWRCSAADKEHYKQILSLIKFEDGECCAEQEVK